MSNHTENPIALPVSETEVQEALPWQVVVLNDPVNLMSYVVMVFRRVFGYDLEKAQQHMLEVHELGQSILWEGELEKAESYVYQLQEWQLTARLNQDA
ncbi:ATP-dependent Clp protease adaptor ClpS [Rubellicoccus peritrichatus]|uniref:ATP-dependent Clp protease adapter protein ClpS n=1 Tax=Rubellicoccus peritrichatus TaxID=3080537 RepID=A0AAQ3LCD8_9BACT|nr:ATP-dependent Clp protease adaptor ClpS [Puniceicoccus sp. CR14]WOO42866.1 ATP-dependent Clp protease adaptor ClpS [Puniceicoccus sp. CR14]